VCNLDDVNLSTGRPRTLLRPRPKGRPSATSVGHMLQVEDDDGFVEGPFGADPDAISTARLRADDVLGIRKHEELVLGR